MRYLLISFTALIAVIFISCQKEIDWGLGGGGGGERLVKFHSQTGTDSTVVTYAYDGNGRIIKETTVGIGQGQTIDMTLDINRNGSGIITTTVQKSAILQSQGIDSVVTRYNYNTGNSRYTSKAFDLTIAGFSVTDSAIFTYDGSGRITEETHWLVSGFIPPFLALKNKYTYSANGSNMTSLELLGATNPGDPLTTFATQTFTFDAKTDAMILKNEAIVLGRTGYYNQNNPTKLEFVDATDPANNFTQDFTYKYTASGKPDSSFSTTTPPGGTVTVTKFFYQ